MTGKVPGSRNYRFARYFRGVGRIVNSAGTANAAEFRLRDGLLTKLFRMGALDTLRLFKSGRLSIAQLVNADRTGRLSRVADELRLGERLETAVTAWVPISARALQSRRRYETSWNRFWAVARQIRQLRDDAVVHDLADVDFHKMRKAWGKSDADWNRARAMWSAFLTYFTRQKFGPFRIEIMSRYPRGIESDGRTPDLAVPDFWTGMRAAPAHARAAFVTMAVLGVGPAEYLALTETSLRAASLTVLVGGTKTRSRVREVAVDERYWDWITQSVPAPLGYGWLRKAWRKVRRAIKRPDLRMYDLRHLSGQLAADAGLSDRDIGVHLGHTNPQQTSRYTKRRTARATAKAIGDALAKGGAA